MTKLVRRSRSFLLVLLAGLFVLLAGVAGAGQTPGRLTLRQTVPLVAHTFHVQGLAVDSSRYWITSVDKNGHRGMLMLFEARTGVLLRSAEIQDGMRYHPGGLSTDADSIWVPVAEYRKGSTSVIQRRNKDTLALQSQFAVQDHIGAIAITPDGIVGANWDARKIYVWDRDGREVRTAVNPSPVAIQDMKFEDGYLIGGGTRPDGTGVVVWIEWPSRKVAREIVVPKTDRGEPYSREGFAIRGRTLWFLPEDDQSRVFVFELAP